MAQKYNDEEKQAALAALLVNEGNVAKTARDTHISERTLRRWRNQTDEDDLSDALLNTARYLVAQMDDDDLRENATLYQIATALRVVLEHYERLKATQASDETPSDAGGVQIVVTGLGE